MKPRIAAICAIVAFAACGDRAPAQFPGCAHISVTSPCPYSSEAKGECQPIIEPQEACRGCQTGGQAFYVVNNCKDGQVQVTIRVTLYDVGRGNSKAKDVTRVPGTTIVNVTYDYAELPRALTFTDQVLTLAPGEGRKLGCSQPASQTQYTWDLLDCRPL
jgi:hypothetical protein